MNRIAVVIATRNRLPLLESALSSVTRARATLGDVPCEIHVVDNGSSDGTSDFLARWVEEGEGRRRLSAPEPGKCRALNRCLRGVSADLIVFTDDDVVVAPDWLVMLARFFAEHAEFDAAGGPIRIPPEQRSEALLKRIKLYPTLPFFEREPRVHEIAEFFGANMAARRRLFEAVGYFDERLGPGAQGFCEEEDFCRRIHAAGLRVGYVPDAVVYHAVLESRLNTAALIDHMRLMARSNALLGKGPSSYPAVLLKIVEYGVGLLASVGRRERWVHKRGRLAYWTEMLRVQRRSRAAAARSDQA